ncbi:MAG: hypothetical protein U5K32_10760 [Bacteroidales bacterium]|nr:hypothetical protein [Bacteroidales bacterium]
MNKTIYPANERGHADEGSWIHQDSWISLGDIEKGRTLSYKLNRNGNGVYLFIIDGEIEVAGDILSKSDATGITDSDNIEIKSRSGSRILLIEVPMN